MKDDDVKNELFGELYSREHRKIYIHTNIKYPKRGQAKKKKRWLKKIHTKHAKDYMRRNDVWEKARRCFIFGFTLFDEIE